MAIQGLRTTADFVTDQRPQNWREGIMLLYPNGKMPLTALTSLMKSRSVDDYTFNWWDKELDDRRFALHATNGDLTTVNTTVILAAGENAKTLKEGDVLLVEQTNEYLFVTQDPGSDTQIVVQRGFAGSTPTAVDANGAGINPNLVCVGSAYEEGSLAPTGVAYDPNKRTNLTQIFRNTLEATRTAIKTNLRTGDAVREAKRECLEYHGIDMERAFFMGKSVDTTRNGKPLHTMNGLYNVIDSNNIVDVNAAYGSGLTMSGLEEYFYNIFQFGSSEKMGIGGNRSLLTIGQILRKNAAWQFQSGIKEYGMNVTRITSPFGELVVKTHPLFNQMKGGTTTAVDYYGMESWLWVLDMQEITYVTLKDSDTKYQPDLQANGMDGLKSGYLTECSIEVHHPKTHYLLKNVVAAAAG